MSSPQSPPSTQPRASSPEQSRAVSHNGFWLRPQNLVIGFSLLLLWVSIAHSLEDFVYGIPARFGLSVATAALILGAGYAVQVTGILLAAKVLRPGYLITLATGAVWTVAAAVDHLGEVLTVWPYREGIISKVFEVGIMLTGAALTLVSLWAFFQRRSRR